MEALFVWLYLLVPRHTSPCKQKVEFLVSRKVCQSAAKLVTNVNLLKAVLNTLCFLKPLSSLNLWPKENVPRTQTCLMGWAWSCLPGKRPLSQTFVKIMMRNLRAITSSCQNALCKSTMWLQQPFSPMLRSSSNSVVCNC